MSDSYLHGSSEDEQSRLDLMNRLINDASLRVLRLGRERRVLDIGCGTGQFTCAIARALGASANVIGIERDERQLETARALATLSGAADQVEFRTGDAFDPPVEREVFDLVHTRFLLEHVLDPGAVVRAMVECARAGGRIILADDDHPLLRLSPEPPGVRAAWRAYYEIYTRRGQDPRVGRHLPELLHRAGARPVRVDQVFYGGCHGSPNFAGLIENLVRVLDGAREAVLDARLARAEDYDAALAALREFSTRPGAALWYAINLAEGVKP